MIHPDRCELEDWVLEGASPAESRALARHVETCLDCAREVEWLRAERRLFTERSLGAPALPPFSGVEQRMLTVEAAAADEVDHRPLLGQSTPFAWARVAGALAAAAATAGLLIGDPFASDPRLTSPVEVPAATAAPPARSMPVAWEDAPQSCSDPSFMPVVFNQECVVVEDAVPPPPPEPKSDCDDQSSMDCLP